MDAYFRKNGTTFVLSVPRDSICLDCSKVVLVLMDSLCPDIIEIFMKVNLALLRGD